MAHPIEECTENVLDFYPTHEPVEELKLKVPEPKDEKTAPAIAKDLPRINWYYLLQAQGVSKLNLNAKLAREDGLIAEFTAAGWVYQRKEDAEKVASKWTDVKRTVKVVRWFEPLLDKVWHGSKDETRLAKKQIRLEIDRHKNNKILKELEFQCNQAGLHWSWLYQETVPDDLSDQDKKIYAHFKPLWDRAKEVHEEIALKDRDIQREEESLRSIQVDQGGEVTIDGIPKKVTDMKSLDDRFAQLEAPGRPCVIINRGDAQPITVSDFKSRLSGEVVVVGHDENNNPKYMSASKFWQGNARKRILTKIAFTNHCVDDSTYNLFSGFGVQPVKGECGLIRKHVKEVICAGNEASFDAFENLCSWELKHIGKPSRIIVILKSIVHQVGKGCLGSDILAKIYGNASFVTSDIGQITTRFNDPIRGKAYVFLDEALFSGNRKAADAIKSMAACTSLGIETKGLPTVQVPIAVNFFLATNHEDAAYIEEEDARYWILEVSPHRAGDVGYFNALYQEIENGGVEAFMHHLLSLDVSGFIPSRDVPKNNAAKTAMIRNSINPYDARKWLEECCRAEMIIGYRPVDEYSKFPWERWEAGREYANSIFPAAYTEWQKGVKSPVAPRPTPSNKFGELLNKAGLEQRNDKIRWRKLPDPEECLKLVAQSGEKP